MYNLLSIRWGNVMGKQKRGERDKGKKKFMKQHKSLSGYAERSAFWQAQVRRLVKQVRAGDNTLSLPAANSVSVKLLAKARRKGSQGDAINALVAYIDRSDTAAEPAQARRLAYELLGVKVPEALHLDMDLLAEDVQSLHVDDEAGHDEVHDGGGPKTSGGR